MIAVGKINKLAISRSTDFGLMLDDGEGGEILLPRRYVPAEWSIVDKLEVFVYLDSEDRLTATTQRPKAVVGEFALLKVKDASRIGAFMDWGLPKDLLVPFREQRTPMREGQSYLVYLYHDRVSGRIVASAKLDKFLAGSQRIFKMGEKVELTVWQRTDLGYKAIIENENWGMVFHNDVFQPLERGQRLTGYIKRVRPDGRIDLALQPPGYGKVTDLTTVILDALKSNGGFLPITDKTPPAAIYDRFGVSKKTYKAAIGALYKKRLIEFTDEGTKLI
ncbi:MAG: GntR family transcriptional regulator [Pontiellaceae bacterium]|nr:GntR family transcriptional regulator [Pontiellaceae bacterium]